MKYKYPIYFKIIDKDLFHYGHIGQFLSKNNDIIELQILIDDYIDVKYFSSNEIKKIKWSR